MCVCVVCKRPDLKDKKKKTSSKQALCRSMLVHLFFWAQTAVVHLVQSRRRGQQMHTAERTHSTCHRTAGHLLLQEEVGAHWDTPIVHVLTWAHFDCLAQFTSHKSALPFTVFSLSPDAGNYCSQLPSIVRFSLLTPVTRSKWYNQVYAPDWRTTCSRLKYRFSK